jgi:hypothetical protein
VSGSSGRHADVRPDSGCARDEFRVVARGARLAMARGMDAHTPWSLSGWLTSTALATAAFWSIFGACVDAPIQADEPIARALVVWDPLQCGDPHRVIVELDAGEAEPIAASAPCAVGALTIDAPRMGQYHGRVYAWTAGATMRSVAALELTLDAPVSRWEVPTPR